MDWLRVAAVVSLLLIAAAVGGSAVRLALGATDLAFALVIGIVALFLLVAIRTGAHDRQWRQNPYW